MFNENSALTKIWVKNVKTKKFAKEQVPNIYNLRTVVYEVLDSLATPAE